MVCLHEVYETISEQCDTVTLNRIVTIAPDGSTFSIEYESFSVPSSAIRCCLASDDFAENVNACGQEEVTYDEWVYDDTKPPGDRCEKVSFTRTDATLRGVMGLVTRIIEEGVPTEISRVTVDESECCLNIDEGCAHSQPGEDVFVDGVCYDGLDGTLCETCDLSLYRSIDFFSSTSAEPITFIKNVVDTFLLTKLAQP